MARKPRTIKNIEAQRKRALDSLMETKVKRDGNSSTILNRYMSSQEEAYGRPNIASEQYRKLNSGGASAYALEKTLQRKSQINQAADNAINRLRKQGKDYRAARKAQGLSAG